MGELIAKKEPKVKKIIVTINGTNTWTDDCNFVVDGDYKKIHVTGTITGCGLAQMHGIKSFLCKDVEMLSSILVAINEYYNKPKPAWRDGKGIGGVIATLGNTGSILAKEYEESLFSIGFQKIATYPNWRHDNTGKEVQSLYIYIFTELPGTKLKPKE